MLETVIRTDKLGRDFKAVPAGIVFGFPLLAADVICLPVADARFSRNRSILD
jgi:hypothetical protein